MYIITVDAPGSLETYKVAGQYVMMKVGDSKPAYFAVASAPGENPMEFLIKSIPETTSETICAMDVGTESSGGEWGIPRSRVIVCLCIWATHCV